jgi:four helix bundle protein
MTELFQNRTDDEKRAFLEAFQMRTKLFALRSIKLFQALPKTEEAKIIGRQFLRSATSVGANHRAVSRSRSKAEFFAKLSVTIEEADEAMFWLEVISESQLLPAQRVGELLKEAEEITRILAKARKSLDG